MHYNFGLQSLRFSIPFSKKTLFNFLLVFNSSNVMAVVEIFPVDLSLEVFKLIQIFLLFLLLQFLLGEHTLQLILILSNFIPNFPLSLPIVLISLVFAILQGNYLPFKKIHLLDNCILLIS